MVNAMPLIKGNKEKIVGLKQTLRALQLGKVGLVCVAEDVDEYVMRKVSDACSESGVPLTRLQCSQRELGRVCRIEVGAAVVALPK